jgi:hypothetical protein
MRLVKLLSMLFVLFFVSACSGGGGGGGGGGSDYPWGNPPGPRRKTPGMPNDPWSFVIVAAGVTTLVSVRYIRTKNQH